MKDWLLSLIEKNSSSFLDYATDQNGLSVFFKNQSTFKKVVKGKGTILDQTVYLHMQLLLESGMASSDDCGIYIENEIVIQLEDETKLLFQLPDVFSGFINLKTTTNARSDNFNCELKFQSTDGSESSFWKLRGPILDIAGLDFLTYSSQYFAIQAWLKWNNSEKNEWDNSNLIAELIKYQEAGLRIDLGPYGSASSGKTEFKLSSEICIGAKSGLNDEIILTPMPQFENSQITEDEIIERKHHLLETSGGTILPVNNQIVLLNEEQSQTSRKILQNPTIKAKDRERFLNNPSEWLANNVFINMDIEFMPRVIGVGEWKQKYFGGDNLTDTDWFNEKPELLALKSESKKESTEPKGDISEPISEEEKDLTLVPIIEDNDDELQFGYDSACEELTKWFEPKCEGLKRQPFPHQLQAIDWIIRHGLRAKENLNNHDNFGAGAILADDMGLGKTLSSLVAISEIWKKTRSENKEPAAALIVCPLSLVENWYQEILQTYKDKEPVFNRVICLHAGNDLERFKVEPGAKDIAEPGKVVSYALGHGDNSLGSIDMPGTCVITTFQTIRNYRFSFAKCRWSIAIFDEAQWIKNPNALQTIAAKALKAELRILTTGTPVENSLSDLWCLMDTANPGPLGSYSEFRANWISPVNNGRISFDELMEHGKKLRKTIGKLMLRRLKKDVLQSIPSKIEHRLNIPMKELQLELYDAALSAVADPIDNDDIDEKGFEKRKTNHKLAMLWELRYITLHPHLTGGGTLQLPLTAKEARDNLKQSVKISETLSILDQIKEKNEKVIIFCIQKKLQLVLSQHLGKIYGLEVPIINGDTKVNSSKVNETRLGLIKTFAESKGFKIIVLSPIAAGAGLNIIAANHVIHLERHWNPAKENQATDRVYRIGQTKEVHVYYPIVEHPDPEIASFDICLDNLLTHKQRIYDSVCGVIPSSQISNDDLMTKLFTSSKDVKEERYINDDDLKNLSWEHFEAIIAEMYSKESVEIILTSKGHDHGCDLIVMNESKNLLIQCKTSNNPKMDSEEGVRQVVGSKPIIQKMFNKEFELVLHTNSVKHSNRMINAGKVCGVEIFGIQWLKDQLKKHPVTWKELLRRNSARVSLRNS